MALLQPMGIKAVAEGVGQFNSKVDSMNKSIDKTNKSTAKAEKSTATLGSALGGAAAVAGVATAAFLAINKALQFGKEGAIITQTRESFGFLIEKIGASSDLLKQLTVASRGTISQMELMTSTATLLAGAGDQLAAKLADATPRLLEIAKAANKLNPSLGDTAFLYQSIATGVKRAQPLILDNLGITIKVGEANEAFAKSIGKTVDELTAEEKAMAILQGTLKAGSNLIDQVGGDTASAADNFAAMGVIVRETTEDFKVMIFEALNPLVSSFVEGRKSADEFEEAARQIGLTTAEATERMRESGLEYEEAREEIIKLAKETKIADEELTNWADGMSKANIELEGTSALVGEVQEKLQPALTLDINILRGMSQLESMSSFLNKWSQEQQQKLRLQVHIETTLETVQAGGAGLAEFQHGGQFVVGGEGGIDKNLVAFRATRGEVVTVTPTSNVDNRSVNMGDVNMGGGGMSPTAFDRMIRSWMGA